MRNYLPLLVIIMLAVVMTACSKYAATNRSYKQQSRKYAKIVKEQPNGIATDSAGIPSWVGTVNFNMRKPNFVVIHHTAQNSCDQTLQTFTKTSTQVSAHYVICRNGTVFHMLNDYLRAWHAGAGRWGNVTDMNSCSIGIELDNNGFEQFTPAQLSSLMILLDTLKKKYSIPTANFIGHADVAPTRKNDPNVFFPWKEFAAKGFGSWYGDTTTIKVPADFNSVLGLRLIGYDVRDSNAAIIAFKRHFMQDTVGKRMGSGDRKVLYSLLTQPPLSPP